jgi:hypothetical protein
LICRDLNTVVAESDLLLIALNDRATLDGLRECARDDQIVIDLTGVGAMSGTRGTHMGLCW